MFFFLSTSSSIPTISCRVPKEKQKEACTVLLFQVLLYSLNNSKFADYVDNIYPNELEIKENTETSRSASYLDL